MKTTPAVKYTIASVAGLVAALVVLNVVVVMALNALGTASAGVCHNPPSRTGSINQVVVVVVCVAAFIAGHMVSWAGTRSRSELHDRLGENAWSDRRPVIVVKIAVTLLLALVTALMALEALMLHWGIWPITYYVRCGYEANTPIALIGAGIFTFLAGRWFWIPK
jgi:hypothetical protein